MARKGGGAQGGGCAWGWGEMKLMDVYSGKEGWTKIFENRGSGG